MDFSSLLSKYESIIAAGAGVIPTLISWWWPSNAPVPLFVYITTVYVLLTIIWVMFVKHKMDGCDDTNKKLVISHIDWDEERLIIRNEQSVKLEVGQCLTLKKTNEHGYHVPIGLISITEYNDEKYQANILLIGNVVKTNIQEVSLDQFVITNAVHHELIERIAKQGGQ